MDRLTLILAAWSIRLTWHIPVLRSIVCWTVERELERMARANRAKRSRFHEVKGTPSTPDLDLGTLPTETLW